jgi:hypothetical protein
MDKPPRAVWSGPGKRTDVAIEGFCIIVDRPSLPFFAGDRTPQAYQSPLLADPTWNELMKIADEVIKTTGDWHHVYLENVVEVETPDLMALAAAHDDEDVPEVKFYQLGMGS